MQIAMPPGFAEPMAAFSTAFFALLSRLSSFAMSAALVVGVDDSLPEDSDPELPAAAGVFGLRYSCGTDF